MSKQTIRIFLTAFFQILLVSVNTILLVNGRPQFIFFVSFGISYIWTLNVTKVAFSTALEKYVYSFGAALGSCTGYWLMALVT